MYTDFYNTYKNISSGIIGPSEYVCSCETLQFTDYSKYAASMFDVEARQARRRDVFPKDMEAAFAMGRRLAEGE